MYSWSAQEIHQAFITKKVSAEEIATYFLARIANFDSSLHSFLEIFEQPILDRAKKLDLRLATNQPLGKMAAVPIAIKDNMHLKGYKTTCASHFLKNYTAPFSATAIELLEKEDALFIGKTNLDEFAMGSSTEHSAFFPTSNPWDLSKVPGGSSGGSSAAVAARLCPIATGSDTGGSIRQPAALCGVVGFKPTYGRVSRYGLVAFGSSLDQIGPFAHNVADLAAVMEIIGHPCKRDATCLDLPAENYTDHLSLSLQEKTIGVPWHFLEKLPKESKENFFASIEQCKKLGATIVDIDLDLLRYSIAIYYILATAEASTNLARFDGIRYGRRSANATTLEEIYDLSREEGFGPEVKQRIMLGTYVLSAGFQDAFYKKAQKMRRLILEAYETAFSTCDLIAMPVSATPAFGLQAIQDPLEMYLQDIFTISANLAGVPAISVPSGFSKEGLPFALQLQGPQLHDVAVVSAGYAFEQAVKATKIPPLFDKERP